MMCAVRTDRVFYQGWVIDYAPKQGQRPCRLLIIHSDTASFRATKVIPRVHGSDACTIYADSDKHGNGCCLEVNGAKNVAMFLNMFDEEVTE